MNSIDSTKNRVKLKILNSTDSTVKINLSNPLRGKMMGNDDTIGIFVVRFLTINHLSFKVHVQIICITYTNREKIIF